MKYILLCLLIFNVLTFLNAQKTYDFTFKDGLKKTITMEYDDPSYLPKWGIDIAPISIFRFTDESFGFCLSPHFRFNKKIMIKGRFATPYAVMFDRNFINSSQHTRKDLAKDMNIMGHFTLASTNVMKKRTVEIERVGMPKFQTVYKGKIERNIERNFCLSGGVGAFNYNTDMELAEYETSNSSIDTVYTVKDFSVKSLNIGFSLYNVESFRFKSTESTTYWGTTRIYGLLTFGLSHNFVVNRDIDDPMGTITTSDIKTRFDNPKYSNNIGYRIGFEKNFGSINTGNSMILGFEFGSLPRLTHPSQPSTITSRRFFMFNVGVGFGPKPKKLK
jgi:hypothetical protein